MFVWPFYLLSWVEVSQPLPYCNLFLPIARVVQCHLIWYCRVSPHLISVIPYPTNLRPTLTNPKISQFLNLTHIPIIPTPFPLNKLSNPSICALPLFTESISNPYYYCSNLAKFKIQNPRWWDSGDVRWDGRWGDLRVRFAYPCYYLLLVVGDDISSWIILDYYLGEEDFWVFGL